MKLLYRFSEWRALAKLRMHTEGSLELMEECTKELGELLRQFRRLTCTKFGTVELQREADARKRRKADIPNATLPQSPNAAPTSVSPSTTTTTGADSRNCDQTVPGNHVPTSKFICFINRKLIYMLRCRCGLFLTWTNQWSETKDVESSHHEIPLFR